MRRPSKCLLLLLGAAFLIAGHTGRAKPTHVTLLTARRALLAAHGLSPGDVKVESFYPHPTLAVIAAPLVGMTEYVYGLGDTGQPWLIAWVLATWAAYSLLNRRRLLLRHGVGLFLTLVVAIVLARYYSSFLGRTSRLTFQHRPKGLLVANFHSHSFRSSGMLTPDQLARWHWLRGYDVMAVTDYNTLTQPPSSDEVLALPGEELKAGLHLVLLGIRATVQRGTKSLADVVAETHAQGGIAIAAHPWSSRLAPQQISALGVDGIEFFNGKMIGSDSLLRLCRHKRVPILGALDYKFGPELHVWSLVFARSRSPAGVLDAVRGGEVAIVTGMAEQPIQGYGTLRSRTPGWLAPVVEVGGYFRNLKLAQGVAWCAWILLFGLALPFVGKASGRVPLPARGAEGRVRNAGPRVTYRTRCVLMVLGSLGVVTTACLSLSWTAKRFLLLPPAVWQTLLALSVFVYWSGAMSSQPGRQKRTEDVEQQ